VALQIAEKVNAEIISVDSMQVYRGLDIGTDKPCLADRRRVPHHLIDIVEVTEPFDVAQFLGLAESAVRGVQSRGKRPLFCGGTGLYFKAFLEGLGELPATHPTLRQDLEGMPMDELLRELMSKDPVTYARIDRQNRRRIVRAVEVCRLTGEPFSQLRKGWRETEEVQAVRSKLTCCGLTREAQDLRDRICTRVERMFERGLVAETTRLLERGLSKNRTAMQAIGYHQVVEHLEGRYSLAETVSLVKQRTLALAKRQLTWFRRQMNVMWIEGARLEDAPALAHRVLTKFNNNQPLERFS
jgi:tRNA dimethylallyltransferase